METNLKRNPIIWKKTDLYEKRPIYIKRGLFMHIIYFHQNIPFYIHHIHEKSRVQTCGNAWGTRNVSNLFVWKETWKETQLYEKRPNHMKRDPIIWNSWGTQDVSKRTYIYDTTKRSVYMKRDLFKLKEPYKRDP